MPILLDTMEVKTLDDSAQKKSAFSPKFFDSTAMTGVGKKSGILCEARNPKYIQPGTKTTNTNINTTKKTYTNGNTTVTTLPVNVMLSQCWGLMYEHKADTDVMTKIGERVNGNGKVTEELFLDMIPHSVVLESTASSDPNVPGSTKKLTVCYQVFLYRKEVSAPAETKFICDAVTPNTKRLVGNDRYDYDFTCNPMETIKHMADAYTRRGGKVDATAIDDFMLNYSLYESMCLMSGLWQTKIHEFIEELATNIETHFPNDNTIKNKFSDQLHQLSDYNVPLDLYKEIYNSVSSHFNVDDATILCKQNLNLLLSDTLNSIDQNKASFTRLPGAGNMNISRYSPEQQAALTTTEPLVLVQAGAGTGKSTVILGRIDYMISAGVKPEDITVLSFTNAAADNITARNPNVHSMTIANMIHQIYSLNYPDHELSTIDTILNALEIYFPMGNAMYDIATKFKRRLYAIKSNDNESFTNMNNFAEQHYDEIITMFNTIGQTCLEMEIILCYQRIQTLQEPASVQSKFLIIDEVQDNSIFEFIYTMRYIDKHKESLFIVGDCSQTLYEFRASNPKALNVLEGSGVFATYKLQVNYRSNQEILDFANVALADIEANQYAHIQLQANSRTPVTEASFTDKVHFYYHQLPKITEFKDALPTMFALDLKKYIDDCLARNEQVAFLAYSRQNCNQIQNILEDMYPQQTTVSLIPAKMYNDTIFSQFINLYWNQIQLAPTQNIISVIVQEIYAKAQWFVRGDIQKKMPSIQKMCGNWMQEIDPYYKSWNAQYLAGTLTQDELITNIRDHMMSYEIRTNAIKQSLLSSRNKENKLNAETANANFLISTIHSAKGLEFSNVVVLYRNENILSEDKKRMYYVAFTRAMSSEFILAYDTAKNPAIQGNYEMLVKALHEKDAQRAAAAAGSAPVIVIDDKGDLTDNPDTTIAVIPVEDAEADMDPEESDEEQPFGTDQAAVNE